MHATKKRCFFTTRYNLKTPPTLALCETTNPNFTTIYSLQHLHRYKIRSPIEALDSLGRAHFGALFSRPGQKKDTQPWLAIFAHPPTTHTIHIYTQS